MSYVNPYLEPTPEPPDPDPNNNYGEPPTPPTPASGPSTFTIILLCLAIAGLFLPNQGWPPLPIPIPIPGPGPDPNPQPDPTPIVDPAQTEGSWIIVVEETKDRTPEIAVIMKDIKYQDSLKERGLVWRPYDKDSAPQYTGIVQEVGLPVLIILGGPKMYDGKDAKGNPTAPVLHKGPLPKTIEEMDTIIRKVTAR